MSKLSGKCSIVRKMPLFLLQILLSSVIFSSFALSVKIDADDATAKYTSFDSFLTAYNSMTASAIPDTVIFAGRNQHTYAASAYAYNSNNNKKLLFISENTNPDSFAILNHTAATFYNLFQSVPIEFDRVIFTGSFNYEHQVETSKNFPLTFKQCIIRNYTSVFLTLKGALSSTISFENCLFTNNITDTIIRLGYYSTSAAPYLTVTNCTFDNNKAVFTTGSTAYATTNMKFANNIFSKSPLILSSLRSKVEYSLTSEATAGYGTGVKQISAADTLTLFADTSRPSDLLSSSWKLGKHSVAEAVGTPKLTLVDIEGAKRDTLSNDAGCYKFDNSLNITRQPKNDTVPVKSLTSFSVSIVSNTDAKFAWYQKGGTAVLDTTDTLEIEVTDTLDSTLYYCVISNKSGSVTSDTVLLRAMKLPVITGDIAEGKNVKNGSPATFTVAAKGYNLSYHWYINDILQPIADSLVDSFTVAEIRRADHDGKTIHCRVSNPAGNTLTLRDTIHVSENLPVITTDLVNDTIYEKDTASFFIAATGITLKYTWFNIDPSTKARTVITNPTSATSTLKIGPASIEAHNGKAYICYVSSLGDSQPSKIAYLHVDSIPVPEIIDQTRSVEALAGEKRSMYVSYKKIPNVSYSVQWYFEDKPLTGAVTDTFKIDNIVSVNAGDYYCIVTNNNGSSDKSDLIKLTVRNVNDIYNPINIKAAFVSRSAENLTVSMTIDDFSALPSVPGSTPYVDTIGVWCKYGSAPLKPEDASFVYKFALSDLISKSGGTNSVNEVLIINTKNDECGKLSIIASPHWIVDSEHDSTPDFVSIKAKDVYTCGTVAFANPLTIGIQKGAVGSVTLSINGLDNLKDYSYVVIYYGKKEENTFFYDTLVPDEISSADKKIDYTNQWFKNVQNSVAWGVYIRAISGNYSDTIDTNVTVGYPVPKNDFHFGPIESKTDASVTLVWSTATTAESVRIWYGTDSATIISSPASTLNKILTGDSTFTVIAKLSSSTQYYFAGQVQRNGIWSPLVDSAFIKCRTDNTSSSTIINTIKIRSSYFDTLTNDIVINYEFDSTGSGKEKNAFSCGYTISKKEYLPSLDNIDPSKSVAITGFTTAQLNTLKISLGDSIDFDTSYFISLYPKATGESYTDASDSANVKVKTGSLKWMPFVYFNSKDTVITFENKIRFIKDSSWSLAENINDTIDLYKFKTDMAPEGYIPVSAAIQIRHPLNLSKTTTPVHFGIKVDSLPVDFTINDVNLYVYDTSTARLKLISTDSIRDVSKNDDSFLSVRIQLYNYSLPLVLMIDTVSPVVTITGDTVSEVSPSSDIVFGVRIKDNCANLRAMLEYGTGSDSVFETKTVFFSDTTLQTLQVLASSGKINKDYGVYAKLYVNDGRYKDTVDISRVVTNTLVINTPASKWYPLSVNYDLKNLKVSQAFDSLSGSIDKKYDNTQFRLFKWYDSTSYKAVTGKYVEFDQMKSSHDSSIFDLKPGNLLWLKTKDIKTLNFGKVTTLSLKKNHIVKLPANEWIDVAVPFGFSMKIYDIIKANKLDSLPNKLIIHKWIPSGSTYVNKKISNPTTNDEQLDSNIAGVYAFYNYLPDSKDTLFLQFPPIPSGRSGYRPSLQKKNSENWNFTIEAETEESESINPVYCGFNLNTNGAKKTQIPLSPFFSSISMGIQNDGRMYGVDVSHEKSDGFVYNIKYVNYNASLKKLKCRINECTASDKNFKLFNSSTGVIENVSNGFEIFLDANSTEQRYLLVGSADFINRFVQNNKVFEFSLLKLYPNPFRGSLNIKFTIPTVGVTSLNCLLFDPLGRTVWNFNINQGLRPGLNTFVWRPGQRSIGKLASGTYFLKLIAKDASGKIIGAKQSRVMYLSN